MNDPLGLAATIAVCAAAAGTAAWADRHLTAPRHLAEAHPHPSFPTRPPPPSEQAHGTPVAKTRGVLVAVGAATACALVITRVGWHPALPADLLLATVAAPLAATDLAEHRLPNRLTHPAIP